MKKLAEIRAELLAILDNYDHNINPANKPKIKTALHLAASIFKAITPCTQAEYHGKNGRERLNLFRELANDNTILDSEIFTMRLFNLTKSEFTSNSRTSTLTTSIINFIASLVDTQRQQVLCKMVIGASSAPIVAMHDSTRPEYDFELLDRLEKVVAEKIFSDFLPDEKAVKNTAPSYPR